VVYRIALGPISDNLEWSFAKFFTFCYAKLSDSEFDEDIPC